MECKIGKERERNECEKRAWRIESVGNRKNLRIEEIEDEVDREIAEEEESDSQDRKW